MDIIPNLWQWKNPVVVSRKVAVFKPSYGPTSSRIIGAQAVSHDWVLGDNDSDLSAYRQIKNFWRAHYQGIPFYLYDPVLNETRTYEIDSDFSFQYNSPDSFSWRFRISEVYPYTKIAGLPPP